MIVPYDEALKVHSQSEGFTRHQIWDFGATTSEQYPLLFHFPYFDLYRKPVVKQADLVLAMHLRGEAFTAPRLPGGINRLAITVCVQSRQLHIEITPSTTTYRIIVGESVSLLHHGQPLTVSAGSPACGSNPKPPTSPAPSQPRNRAPTPHSRAT